MCPWDRPRQLAGRQLFQDTLRNHKCSCHRTIRARHKCDFLRLRKPGAFERYRYREELFPTLTFRQAHDRMVAEQGRRHGSLEYLRLLKLASEVGQNDLELMLVEYVCPPYPSWTVDKLRELLQPKTQPQPTLAELKPEWSSYDALLTSNQEVTHVC